MVAHLMATTLSRALGPMGEYVRRFKGRLSKAHGIVAGAHKLARIIWALIVSGQPYDQSKAFNHTPASIARRLKNLQNQAQALKMKLRSRLTTCAYCYSGGGTVIINPWQTSMNSDRPSSRHER